MQIPSWLPSVVWTDYRVAVLFTVLLPLALLIWSFVQRSESLQQLLIIYWKVSSLLAITVYLFIGAIPVGFISGWLARILIPLSLWFWADLNEEITEQPTSRLKTAFTAWRWGVTIYSLVGAVAQIPTLQCALMNSQTLKDNAFCRLWLEPTWLFRDSVHATTRPYFLGFLGLLALGIYVLSVGYFVIFRLGKQGRSATGQ